MTDSGDSAQEIRASDPLSYARIYTSSDDETHFSDESLSFTLADFAPPAPPISVSEAFRADGISFISSPPGWHGDWHPTPRRQLILVLVGVLEVEVSDGEVRRFDPGSVCLVEDTTGKGHVSRVVGSVRVQAAAIPLGGD